MKNLLFTFFLFTATIIANAQIDLNKLGGDAIKGLDMGNLNMGSVIGELGKGIKPTMLSDAWQNKVGDWTKNVANIKDVPGAVKSLSGLVKNIKPEAFTSGFAALKGDWLKNLSRIKDMTGLGNSLKTLMGGLKPEALTSDFLKKQVNLGNALNLLK
ncbi:MAG: hypothetical protein JNK61_03665 [Bacteroidia bacterium]|nr:hypothetical protein [Bacteroidia bacterium]HQU99944.1 hypothetical protein [Bacteroidia bacterium]